MNADHRTSTYEVNQSIYELIKNQLDPYVIESERREKFRERNEALIKTYRSVVEGRTRNEALRWTAGRYGLSISSVERILRESQ